MTSTQDPPEEQPLDVGGTTLYYTDRSRLMAGWTRCPRERYLEYHSGPTGYGIRKIAESMPLVTGSYTHDIVRKMMTHPVVKKGTQGAIPREDAREIIGAAGAKYERVVGARGFLELPDEAAEEVKHVVREQRALIEGLGWVFWKYYLEPLRREYHVLQVEQETLCVLDCGCGLGEGGSAEDHLLRGCEGIGLMLKPDMVLQHKKSLQVTVWDCKTTGYLGQNWEAKWYNNVQLALHTLGVERTLGVEVDSAYILGLYKGKREREWDKEKKKAVGPKRQNSVLCYAFKRPANPPFLDEDWQLDYYYKDEDGKGRSLKGKGYEKAPTWEFLTDAAAVSTFAPGVTPIEAWVEFLPEDKARAQYCTLGPLEVNKRQLMHLKRGIVGEERAWQGKLWRIWEKLEEVGGDENHPEFVELLDHEVPQSWNCVKWGTKCQFHWVCLDRQPGEDPTKSGRYEPRRPHHDPELQQVLSRGIELPEHQDEDAEEEEEA